MELKDIISLLSLPPHIVEILEQQYFGNTVMAYGLVACVIVVAWILAFVASFIVRKVLGRVIDRWSEDLSAKIVLAIRRPVRVLTFMAGSTLGSQLLNSDPVEGEPYAHWAYNVVNAFFTIGMRLSVFWIAARLLAFGWHEHLKPLVDKHIEGEEKRFFPVAYKLLVSALWIWAIANCIPVLGYDAAELLLEILSAEAVENTIGQYLAFLGLTLLTLLLARTIFNTMYRVALKVAEEKQEQGGFHFEQAWFEGFQRPLLYLITLIGFRLSASVLSANPLADHVTSDLLVHGIITGVIDVCLAVDVTWIFFMATDKIYEHFVVPLVAGKSSGGGASGGFDEQLLPLTRKAAKTGIAAVGGIFMIQALGKDPTTVLAGLGIGGVAIGFAAKDTIAPFISGIAIYLTHPYRIGDYISVGDDKEGMVEEIGLRATSLRTKMGTSLLVPNDRIISGTIHNMMRNGRAYDGLMIRIDIVAEPHKRDEAIEILKASTKAVNGVHDPEVTFLEYGPDDLGLMLQYWLDDAKAFWKVRHQIMMQIDTRLRDARIELATPSAYISLKSYLPESDPEQIRVLQGPAPRSPASSPLGSMGSMGSGSAPGPLTPPKL